MRWAIVLVLVCSAGCGSSGGDPDACSEGMVTASCTCGADVVGDGYCCGNVAQATPCFSGNFDDIIPPDRVTTWDPGITSDGQLGMPLGDDGLPQRTMVCATLSPGQNIQAAIDACPEG